MTDVTVYISIAIATVVIIAVIIIMTDGVATTTSVMFCRILLTFFLVPSVSLLLVR